MPSVMTTPAGYLAGIPVGVLPVIAFLVSLVFLDSYKLVSIRTLLLTILVGVGVAFASVLANTVLIRLSPLSSAGYSRYIAPVIEEGLKAAYIVYLIRSKRVGFMVDTAIQGFALGAGLAIVENVYHIAVSPDPSLPTLVLRGFGTAVMHGGATALFGIVSQSLSERYVSTGARVLAPGLAVAIAIHSLYNHFLLSPVLSVIVVLLVLPLVLIFAFQQSEKGLRNWLGVGFDTDAELLEMIKSGQISRSRIGEYMMSLKEHFPAEVLADMLCLLRIHTELSIKAKGILLMREAGFRVSPDPTLKETFDELSYLEGSIGKTGMLAMAPFLSWNTRELWQLHVLGQR
jgi:hypothetical protein